MTVTLDLITIIAMLVASFYRYAMLPITCLSSHPRLPWTSNLWHLSYANRCLAMLPLLLSPSYSVASCRWSWSWFHVGTWIFWDITISLVILMLLYILVKGGRLGLMPGVLFHSCRPSFPTYRYYVPWVCVPYAVGWFMGPPWQFALNKTLPARPNLGFTFASPSLFPLGVAHPEGHLYFSPPPRPVLL